jgi:hypothetical protein
MLEPSIQRLRRHKVLGGDKRMSDVGSFIRWYYGIRLYLVLYYAFYMVIIYPLIFNTVVVFCLEILAVLRT